MKKEYYNRGKKIEIEQLTDTLAIKQEASSDRTRDVSTIEKNLGTRTKLSTDSRDTSRLSEQQEIFEKAGYVFIKPNENTRSLLDSRAPRSELPNTGSVFVDKEGSIKIGTGRLTIKFKPDVSKNEIDELLGKLNLKIIRQLKFADLSYEVEVQDMTDPLDLSIQLHSNKKIAYAEPILNEHIPQRHIPTDPRYNDQWQWRKGISIEQTWDISRGEGIKIALIDLGFDLSNPDISPAVMKTAGYFKDNNIGDVDFVNDSAVLPKHDHGTFCSGMALARSDNQEFGCGAANRASFIPIVMRGDINSQLALARAVAYATDPTTEIPNANKDDGADIISVSLGPAGRRWTLTSVLEEAIIFATTKGRHGLGTPIFWAVDNTSDWPISTDEVCSHPDTIAIGRVNQNDEYLDYLGGSAFGPELDLVAPGADVYNIYFNHPSHGTFGPGIGTSYAAPLAAGVGALVLSVNPKLNPTMLTEILHQTCDKVGGVTYDANGHHIRYGYGRINALKAVNAAMNK
jgi:subtilisin family serine protease